VAHYIEAIARSYVCGENGDAWFLPMCLLLCIHTKARFSIRTFHYQHSAE